MKYRDLVGGMYVVNIVFQAIFTLLTPAALGFFVSWFFVRRGAPDWIYAVLVPLGIVAGFVSMIRFVISASEALERMEKERDKK